MFTLNNLSPEIMTKLGITFILFLVSLGIVVYIYNCLALMVIAKKLKEKNYGLAWIPIVNFALILKMGEFAWQWVFLIFIPIFGWIALGILMIIASWRIYEKRKYPGWLVVLGFIPYIGFIISLVTLGFVAWKDK